MIANDAHRNRNNDLPDRCCDMGKCWRASLGTYDLRRSIQTKLFTDGGDECPHKDLVQKLLMLKDVKNDNVRL
jgi:hypothetical protein